MLVLAHWTLIYIFVCVSFDAHFVFFFTSRRRHTRCALVTGVQTCALPILDQRLPPDEPRQHSPAQAYACDASRVRSTLRIAARCRLLLVGEDRKSVV